jgi:predicted nucleic acid-binding Zn ribbon protein
MAKTIRVTCLECGKPHETRRLEAKFCSEKCRSEFKNRRKLRGAELYDLFMSMRYSRDEAANEGVWNFMCRMAQHYKAQDDRDREGRQSWTPAKEVKARHPHLNATVVNTNAAGNRR